MFADLPELKNEPGRAVYSIENSKGECLGFTEVSKHKYDMEINILETAPNLANNTKNSHSPVKYVGETLLSFVINKAFQGLNHEINLYPGKSSVGFYADKCLMDYDDKKKLCTLPFIRYGVILQQNADHTGSYIDFNV